MVFFATPAEEYGEVEYKNTLMDEGKIAYGGGKCELIRTGDFDDIDLCLAHHIAMEGIALGSGSGNGFVSKVIRIKGKAAHAAACPEDGDNAWISSVFAAGNTGRIDRDSERTGRRESSEGDSS